MTSPAVVEVPIHRPALHGATSLPPLPPFPSQEDTPASLWSSCDITPKTPVFPVIPAFPVNTTRERAGANDSPPRYRLPPREVTLETPDETPQEETPHMPAPNTKSNLDRLVAFLKNLRRFINLLRNLLDPDILARSSAHSALQHSWLDGAPGIAQRRLETEEIALEEMLVKRLRLDKKLEEERRETLKAGFSALRDEEKANAKPKALQEDKKAAERQEIVAAELNKKAAERQEIVAAGDKSDEDVVVYEDDGNAGGLGDHSSASGIMMTASSAVPAAPSVVGGVKSSLKERRAFQHLTLACGGPISVVNEPTPASSSDTRNETVGFPAVSSGAASSDGLSKTCSAPLGQSMSLQARRKLKLTLNCGPSINETAATPTPSPSVLINDTASSSDKRNDSASTTVVSSTGVPAGTPVSGVVPGTSMEEGAAQPVAAQPNRIRSTARERLGIATLKINTRPSE